MVGKICTVCRRNSYIDRDLSYFSYPGDPYRRHKWLKAVGRLDLAIKLNNPKTRGNHRICEMHFERKFVTKSKCEGRNFLTKHAFPTLLLDNRNQLIPIHYDNSDSSLKTKNAVSKEQHTNKNPSKITFCSSNNLPRPQPIRIQQNFVNQQEGSLIKTNRTFESNIYIKDNSLDSSTDESDEEPDVSQFCESVIKVTKGTQTQALVNKTTSNLNGPLDNKRWNSVEYNDTDKTTFLQMCSTFLSPSLCKVIEWTFSVKGSQNVNLTFFALSLYYSSDLYKLLKDMLGLPSIETLKYFLLPKTTKLTKQFLNAFRCKVNTMSPRERMCSFSVGSILLKPHLYYNITHDSIIGFHDVNGIQNKCVAKYAILLMVQGILEDWCQPISYAFISEYDNYPEISVWIDEVLTSLMDIGLDIKVFVSDPRSEFLYASDSRFASPERTCFTINGTDIFYTYDTIQLLKIVKNNLKSCNFNCGVNFNGSNNIDFFKKLKNLCDILNAKSQYSDSLFKRAYANKKYQKDFLNHMLHLFRNLRVVRKTDGVDVTENMKFVEDFQITIKSLLQLFDELHFLGEKYLLTSRLNHNCLNKFFRNLTHIYSKGDCTPRQFTRSFVRSFVYNMLKKSVGQKKIADSLDSEDFCQQLLNKDYQETVSDVNQPLRVFTTDYRQGLPDRNAFVYVCGYCYLKCIQEHDCDIFRSYIDESQKLEKNNVSYVCSISLDLKIGNCEMLPPDNFTEFLMRLESKFKEYMKANIKFHSIGQRIMKEFEKFDFGAPCPCFPVDYLKTLFVRMRLFYTIRQNNKLFKKRKGAKSFRVFSL